MSDSAGVREGRPGAPGPPQPPTTHPRSQLRLQVLAGGEGALWHGWEEPHECQGHTPEIPHLPRPSPPSPAPASLAWLPSGPFLGWEPPGTNLPLCSPEDSTSFSKLDTSPGGLNIFKPFPP